MSNEHKESFQLMLRETSDKYVKVARIRKYLDEWAKPFSAYIGSHNESKKFSYKRFRDERLADKNYDSAFKKVMRVDESLTVEEIEILLKKTTRVHTQVKEYMQQIEAIQYN
ncbi:hypothetical protein V4T71_002918 [Vibrio vulnificus]